ncbi:MAG: efflux RND transporter periplasmic adaptor subunit [Perlucidibaca sp.]
MTRKTLMISMAALGALGLGGWGLYSLGMHQGMAMSSPSSTEAGKAEPRVLYWHDPMMPDQHFDKPGKSPFMDMDLVPVYAEESAEESADKGAEAGGISIPSQVRQNLGIRTAEVKSGQLSSELTAVGSVTWNERAVAVMQARASGFVERLSVRAVMDKVRQGQVLAELYVPDWVAAQEEFLAVRGMSGEGSAELRQGARQRMRLVGMSEAQIALVERSGRTQPRLAIVAPASGVVVELGIREGMTVTPGATLFRINGLDSVWVNAEVPEAMAAQVRPGGLVEATTSAWPGKVFKGRVSALLPEVDATTRTLKARVELANPDAELVPGRCAPLRLAGAPRAAALLVPSEAVIRTGQRRVVFTVDEAGSFHPVDVTTGREGQGETEILTGLEAGQKVVVSGQFLVDSEASLKGVGSRMQADDMPAGMDGRMDMRGMGQ